MGGIYIGRSAAVAEVPQVTDCIAAAIDELNSKAYCGSCIERSYRCSYIVYRYRIGKGTAGSDCRKNVLTWGRYTDRWRVQVTRYPGIGNTAVLCRSEAYRLRRTFLEEIAPRKQGIVRTYKLIRADIWCDAITYIPVKITCKSR